MATLWPFLKHWLTDDKAGLTLATWCFVLATFMLVVTGFCAIAFTWLQLAANSFGFLSGFKRSIRRRVAASSRFMKGRTSNALYACELGYRDGELLNVSEIS
jgi:hypothetical protein